MDADTVDFHYKYKPDDFVVTFLKGIVRVLFFRTFLYILYCANDILLSFILIKTFFYHFSEVKVGLSTTLKCSNTFNTLMFVSGVNMNDLLIFVSRAQELGQKLGLST